MYNCLNNLYGKDWTDADIASYRKIEQKDAAMVTKYTFDDPKSDRKELVHIYIEATNVVGITLNLNNPNATYCLEVSSTAFGQSEINVDCYGHFDEQSTATIRRNVKVNRIGCQVTAGTGGSGG